MKRLKSLVVVILLSGCYSKVIFTPSELPNAITGEPYNEQINISGGSGPIASSHSYTLTPKNTGLHIDYCDKESPVKYNCIVVKGMPKKEGVVYVHLIGGTIPTSFTFTSVEFDEGFNINIRDKN